MLAACYRPPGMAHYHPRLVRFLYTTSSGRQTRPPWIANRWMAFGILLQMPRYTGVEFGQCFRRPNFCLKIEPSLTERPRRTAGAPFIIDYRLI